MAIRRSKEHILWISSIYRGKIQVIYTLIFRIHNYDFFRMHGIKSASAAPQEEGEHIIATYELIYQRGKVIVLGIYSDDIITNSKFDKSFDNLVLRGWIS